MKIIERLDNAIMNIEKAILSYSIIFMALFLVGNVLSRTILGKSWLFVQEATQFLVVVATFMGISYAARKGRHISMSAFFDMAPYKVKKVLAIFIPALTSVIMMVLTYFAFQYLLSVQASGRVTPALELPAYFMAVFVPIGLALGSLQYIRNLWINIKKKEVYVATDKIATKVTEKIEKPKDPKAA